MPNLKKMIYVLFTTIGGVLVSLLVHGVVELIITNLLLADFETYNLGLSWQEWFVLHDFLSLLLVALGVFYGVRVGLRWWKLVYNDGEAERIWSWLCNNT
jgi:hypothetical protein